MEYEADCLLFILKIEGPQVNNCLWKQKEGTFRLIERKIGTSVSHPQEPDFACMSLGSEFFLSWASFCEYSPLTPWFQLYELP